MKVILRHNVENVGERGNIVDVKPGYGRNYLIPKGLAYTATKGNIAKFSEEKRVFDTREAKELVGVQEIAKKLNKISLTAQVKIGEEEKVFGSVTAITIHDLLTEQGFEIDKKIILLDEPIKSLGQYKIPIKLHSQVEAKVKLWVVKEPE